MLFDSHAHLDQIENLASELAQAKSAGVNAIAAMSVNFDTCKKNLEIADLYQSIDYPAIYLGMGIHPGEIKVEEVDPCLKFMHDNLEKINFIGEIGLDFWYPWVRKDDGIKALQRETFKKMLNFAFEHSLPAAVHSRGKWQECFDEVKNSGIKRAVFHWFSGPKNVLDQIINAGYYVSITPSLEYSPETQQTALNAPVEQTMIETDCPVFYRNKLTGEGFRSAPKDVQKTLSLYAELKKMPEEKAAEILYFNTEKFFQKSN